VRIFPYLIICCLGGNTHDLKFNIFVTTILMIYSNKLNLEENKMNKENTLEEKYPSVEFAYDIALKSYDWAIQRSDAVDSRIDRQLAWFSSINIGLVAFIATKYPTTSFHSFWFTFSVAIFLESIILGIFTKLKGSLKLVSATELWKNRQHWFAYTPWEFKKRNIKWAARHYELNQDFVNWKGTFETAINIIFLIEITTLIIWIIRLGRV
jgi:hypothetical protein